MRKEYEEFIKLLEARTFKTNSEIDECVKEYENDN